MPPSPLPWKCPLSFVPVLRLVQLKLWIDEKMLTAQDVSYDEARNLHTKWQKHQAFMAELAANKDWLDKVDKVSGAVGAASRQSPPPCRGGPGSRTWFSSWLETVGLLVPQLHGGKLWPGKQTSLLETESGTVSPEP